MSNEAILRDRLADPIDFTIADAQAVERGALLSLHDPRTCSGSRVPGEKLAGIAAREKVASDGRTRLAVFRHGIFDMVASGSISIGMPVMSASQTSWLNTVKAAPVGSPASGSVILGTALEAASDAEVFQVYVNLG